ncbi:MAG: hypothetical protein U0798_00175 [Gemmataceae bacterium]
MTFIGLTGCRSLEPASGGYGRSESGYTNVIRSVPEPDWTQHELTSKPERVRWSLRTNRGGTPTPATPEIPPFAERNPSELTQTKPQGTENGFEKLPRADLATQTPAVAIKPGDGPFRAITEQDVRSLAVQYAPSARRIEMENLIPISHGDAKQHWPSAEENCSPALDRFLRAARVLAAQGARVKSAGEAAQDFYELASAAGRSEILRIGIAEFDELRAELKAETSKPVIPGRPRLNLPDVSTLDTQRGQMLETAILLNGLTKSLNVDLKRMTGMVGNTSDQLYPTGDFGIDLTPLDVPALVHTALETRPDLQLLRLAYYELNEDSLPAIRDQLRQRIGFLAPTPTILGRHHSLLATALQRFGKKPDFDPVLVHEVAIRRAQLFDIICEEERKAADDVRKAAIGLQSSADLIASARTRSEELGKKVEKKPANLLQSIADFPNRMEWYKARAEVINAVMGWHKARVMLMMAQGKVE